MKRQKYRRLMKREAAKQNLDIVHNLSEFELTEDMKSVLNKGLSFVPTVTPTLGGLGLDVGLTLIRK